MTNISNYFLLKSGFLAQENAFHQQDFLCDDGSIPRYHEGKFDKIVGIIGGQHSEISVQVSLFFYHRL